jgi:hypothetical protein
MRDGMKRSVCLLSTVALHFINACKGRLQVHSGFPIAVAIPVGYLQLCLVMRLDL